jgi:hypothetical protein
MSRRLRIYLFTALAIALCGAVAQAGVLNGGHKQTDFPNLGLYLQVLDPQTMEPLMVMGPDKQPIECPPSQTPRDAILRAIFLPNPGSRTTIEIRHREHDGRVEPLMERAPFVHDYYPEDEQGYLLGPHIIKGVIWTDERRWEPKAEVYSRISVTVDEARYCPLLPQPVAAPVSQPARPQIAQPVVPARPVQPAPAQVHTARTLVYLTNGRFAMKVALDLPTNLCKGDMLVFKVDGEQVAVANITAVRPQMKATMVSGVGSDVSDADTFVRRGRVR